MNAMVITPVPHGWGFPPGLNLVRLKPRVTHQPQRLDSRSLAAVECWLASCRRCPTLDDVQHHFGVSRATGYRYIAMWRGLREAA